MQTLFSSPIEDYVFAVIALSVIGKTESVSGIDVWLIKKKKKLAIKSREKNAPKNSATKS